MKIHEKFRLEQLPKRHFFGIVKNVEKFDDSTCQIMTRAAQKVQSIRRRED